MKNTRSENAKRNIVYGVTKQIANIIIPFINRTIVLYLLGAEYQGLTGLFSSILQILNLTDFGFSTAVVFVLYKPIADNDKESICSVIAYLKRIYTIIGCVMLIFGLSLLPFLNFFISSKSLGNVNIYILYLIYLANTIISYLLFGYKSALFTAMQREDIVSKISTFCLLFSGFAQAIILLVYKNIYLYVLVLLIASIINNFLLQIFSLKMYKEIYPKGSIKRSTKSAIEKQIKALFINKVGDVARNSIANIIISVMLGLSAVAVYGNYYYVFSALYGITLAITNAMQASVGNSIVTETVKKNERDLLKFNFIFSWISGWWSICMFVLYQPFMSIWMKQNPKMLLSFLDMCLFCIYFYAITMNNNRNVYINANGLFWECRKWYIRESLVNLLLNLILGYFLGITGILLANILTIFVFNFIARTNVLFHNYFKSSPNQFYKQYLFYFCITIITGLFTYYISTFVLLDKIASFIVKALICCFIPNIVFYFFYRKNGKFEESKTYLRKVLSLKKV